MTLRVLLSLLCGAWVAFIFSNSTKGAGASATQSSGVVNMVQQVVGAFAPNSAIANATGEAYDRLHGVIRTLAHFTEFALLGGLVSWCCFSYTFKKIAQAIPPIAVCVVAILDECLQLLSAGRAFQVSDILIDIAGGIVGVGFAILTVWLGSVIIKRRRVRRETEALQKDYQAQRAQEEE